MNDLNQASLFERNSGTASQPASQPASQLYQNNNDLVSHTPHFLSVRAISKGTQSLSKLPAANTTSSIQATPASLANQQVVSKQRVADHGEVYTNPREVGAMLDLVKDEAERIDSRFLEPACGTGNFLVEILSRKLATVERTRKKHQTEFERDAILAVSSIYGIDILADNIAACQARLFDVFDAVYTRLYKTDCTEKCRRSVHFILHRNILHGDALTLKTVIEPVQPIVFSEWAAVNGSQIKRRDFVYGDLVDKASERELPLFSDLGEAAFIPEPIQDYPLVHFLDLGQSTGAEVSHV